MARVYSIVHSLIFGEVFVQLDIAPDLAAVVDLVNLKLDHLDMRESKMAKDSWGL